MEVQELNSGDLIVSAAPSAPILRIVYEFVPSSHPEQLVQWATLALTELVYISLRRGVLSEIRLALRLAPFAAGHRNVIEEAPTDVRVSSFCIGAVTKSEDVLRQEEAIATPS